MTNYSGNLDGETPWVRFIAEGMNSEDLNDHDLKAYLGLISKVHGFLDEVYKPTRKRLGNIIARRDLIDKITLDTYQELAPVLEKVERLKTHLRMIDSERNFAHNFM